MPINETVYTSLQTVAFGYIDTYLGSLSPVSQAFAIIAGGYILGKMLAFFGKKVVYHFTKRTQTNLDDIIVEAVYGCLSKVLFLGAIYISLFALLLHKTVVTLLGKLILSCIYIVVIWYSFDLINGTVDIWGGYVGKKVKIKNFQHQVFPFFKKSIKIVVFFVTAILILQLWGVDIGPFLASLGIVGIVIGLALQGSLSNIFGGISLILDNAYKTGDKITLDSGKTGVVTEVGLRSTRIKTYDGHQLMVPNAKMASMTIANYHQPNHEERVVVEFGVTYGTSIENVRKLLIPKLKKVKNCAKDPSPEVVFVVMGDWDLKCKAILWVDDIGDWWQATLETTELVYETLNKSKNISIPFPTQTVHVKK